MSKPKSTRRFYFRQPAGANKQQISRQKERVAGRLCSNNEPLSPIKLVLLEEPSGSHVGKSTRANVKKKRWKAKKMMLYSHWRRTGSYWHRRHRQHRPPGPPLGWNVFCYHCLDNPDKIHPLIAPKADTRFPDKFVLILHVPEFKMSPNYTRLTK